MGCGCHGESKMSVGEVKPYDQCLMCARKHVNQAWQLWHEFMHEMDNRDYCSAELRACASHCKYLAKDVAIECRDIAKQIEMMQDDGRITSRIEGVREKVTTLFLADNPDFKAKLDTFKERN